MKIKKLHESACWFGKYFDIHGKKKLVYISKDLTGDADEADNMMQDMISEPFTKFIFGGSVDSRMAEAEGMTLLEKKLNESTNTTDEFYEIVDTVIGPAINSIGGDMDDITGDIAQTYDEDKFFVSLYSTVPRKLANRFSKNFLNTVQTALSKTRFSDVSLDSDRTFAYRLSRMDIHNHLGSERGDQFLSEFAMFEIGITAYGARLNEAMTIAYDKSTITNMIDRIQRNLDDYKSLLSEFPDDAEYWKEMISKCQTEIDELRSYEPLGESLKENISSDFEEIKTKFNARTRFGSTVIDGDKSEEIGKALLDKGYNKGSRKSWSTGSGIEYVNPDGSKITVGVDNVADYDRMRGTVIGSHSQTIITLSKNKLSENVIKLQENLSTKTLRQKRRK